MQILILTALLLGLAVAASAQNFSEWWQQKKTRIKYLVAQVAALETFEKTLANGYALAENGIHTIGDLHNGEFHLHQEYFQSLCMVSPAVRNSTVAGACVQEQQAMLDQLSRFDKRYSSSPWLTPADKEAIDQIFNSVLEKVEAEGHQIVKLISDDSLLMTDGERILALNEILVQAMKRAVHLWEIEEMVEIVICGKRRAAGEETLLKILE